MFSVEEACKMFQTGILIAKGRDSLYQTLFMNMDLIPTVWVEVVFSKMYNTLRNFLC